MSGPQDIEAAALQDAARLRQTLDSASHQLLASSPVSPYLVVLSGLPGTGKSHFAHALAQVVPFLIIGSDRSRKTLVHKPRYSRGEHTRVFTACHLVIEELLAEGHRVIFDATNLTERFHQPLYEIAERTDAGMVLVWFTASREIVRRRLDDRAAGRSQDSYSDADWQIYCRLRPGEESIARPHLVVDSAQDISPTLEEVVRRVTDCGQGLFLKR